MSIRVVVEPAFESFRRHDDRHSSDASSSGCPKTMPTLVPFVMSKSVPTLSVTKMDALFVLEDHWYRISMRRRRAEPPPLTWQTR